MVAISLYRGNLHKVPSETPRQWLLPRPLISVKLFRHLLSRRSKALSLLPSNPDPNPNPNFPPLISNPPQKSSDNDPEIEDNGVKIEDDGVKIEVNDVKVEAIENSTPLDPPPSKLAVDFDSKTLLVNDKGKDVIIAPNSTPDPDSNPDSNPVVVVVDDPIASELPANDKGVAVDEKEKRKKEVEEKLKILNEKKHNLVQALKQILNAEEELKRRSSMQASRPPLPLVVDGSNDSGSMTRLNTPRTGSDANITVDMVEGEGDNPQSRQLLRMNSTSPSAESAFRRAPYFQHNAVSHPSRAALVAAGSPSRFAPSGNQAHPSNLPTVSVSGTNYIPSSPSPAASGGTSGFRDVRHPSPWN